MSIYEELGVKQCINAWGPMTRIGSSRMRPEVLQALEGGPGTRVSRDEALYSEGIPVAKIVVDAKVLGRSASDVAAALSDGNPGIRVTQVKDWLSVNPQFLEPGEETIVARRLKELLGA